MAEQVAVENEEEVSHVSNLETTEEEVIQPELNEAEQKAWDGGWRPEDQFEGNPDNWKTAREYNMYGEFQEQLRGVQNDSRKKDQEFDTRIANLNKLHEHQTETAINTLRSQQRQAVEEADTEEFDRLQAEIDGHNTSAVDNTVPAKDPAIVAWESANPWINDDGDEKAQQAMAFFNVAASRPNATPQSALKYVDDQLAKLHPAPTNPRREMPTNTETSTRQSSQRQRSRDLTMNDLTRDEADQYKQFGHSMFASEKDFLKAVADARKS
tara:strand:+ start:20059 stop:20865 length:807 start_codon:yes stop_codon:yes gene_type:complete